MTSRGEDKTVLNTTPPTNYNTTQAANEQPASELRTNKDGVLVRLPSQETAVYHTRWYVLLVFFVTGVLQGWMWNTYGPIAEALTLIGWPLSYIAAAQVVLCSSSTLGAPLCVWIMDRKGLRLAMVFATLTLAIGCSLRCFTSQSPAFPVLTMVAFVIDGLGGTVSLSAAASFSSVWFPPRQRVFATAVCVESTNVGIALGMLIGPIMVTSHVTTTKAMVNGTAVILEEAEELIVRKEVMQLMYIQCAIAVSLLILVVCYFPKKPPKPPSISASCERDELWKGLKGAFKNWKLWLLFIPYGTGCGIYFAWTSVYDVILVPIGFTESESGWLAFNGTMCGIMAAVLISIFAGLFMRHIKKIVLFLLAVTIAAVLAFTLISEGYVRFSWAGLYISALTVGAVLYAIVPLCFELACEVVYPISENVICLMLQWWNNVFVIFFFLMFLIPSPHRTWMNWMVVACVVLSFLSFALLPEFYARLSIDDGEEQKKETKEKVVEGEA